MAKASPCPLFEKRPGKNTTLRIFNLVILFLLLCLLTYRLSSLNVHGLPWLVAFACELWFTLYWILNMNSKWNPVDYHTYPERLLQRVKNLPRVDMFVTTADAELEPPIITANTVLSLLAVDYPAHKLACYVSDDGFSPVTFFSLAQVSKFAQFWVPFCKKYQIQVRAPFRYFSTMPSSDSDFSSEFWQDRQRLKDEYEILCGKIQDASQSFSALKLTGDFEGFSNAARDRHPSLVKVIWENKGEDENGVPHLVYISREKNPKHPHHYKAGAMNVLSQVSGVMTNAPFMLNVDCDMYAHNPKVLLHAMCLHLGFKDERDTAFVQSPQRFYGAPKDDPFGNQYVVLQKFILRGMAGLQGPIYGGTGCVHRRKVIYGLSPHDIQRNENNMVSKFGKKALEEYFGNSVVFQESAIEALSGSSYQLGHEHKTISSSRTLEAAQYVAGCRYEHDTLWGKEVGWIYGSTAEDVNTGLKIKSRGWRSIYCDPDPPGFLGRMPLDGPGSMTQQKRWGVGLLEILVSKNNPLLLVLFSELQFRMGLSYLVLLVWALRSIPELAYTMLPACCLISGTSVLPKIEDPAIGIPGTLFILYNVYNIWEFQQAGESIRAWWNTEKMWLITSTSAWLFAIVSVALKVLGISETVFEITQKDESSACEDDNGKDNGAADVAKSRNIGRFNFDRSPMFIPGTTIMLVNIAALGLALLRLVSRRQGYNNSMVGEIASCVWVVMHYSPFLKGLFGKGKYGIPWTTLCKSVALVAVFLAILLYR